MREVKDSIITKNDEKTPPPSSAKVQHESILTDNSKVFGTIDDVCEKYSISRGDEVHTKVIDVPAPFKSRFRVDDVLEPSRYLFFEFEGIYLEK